MLNNLIVVNYDKNLYSDRLINYIPLNNNLFSIITCQRELIIQYREQDSHHKLYQGAEIYEDAAGYTFLLETILGLKSKLIGENEVMGQFKEAFLKYLEKDNPNSKITTLIQSLFKDAKKIRSKYLIDIGQYSYAGITKNIVTTYSKKQNIVPNVLIVGSGLLADSIVKFFTKKFKPIIIARNQNRVTQIKDKYQIKSIPWEELENIHQFQYIINSIGTKDTLFTHDFFSSWMLHKYKLFIDLGAPSSIKTELGPNDDVLRLNDIFTIGATLNDEKEQKIREAKLAISDLVSYKQKRYHIHLPFGWEELQFV